MGARCTTSCCCCSCCRDEQRRRDVDRKLQESHEQGDAANEIKRFCAEQVKDEYILEDEHPRNIGGRLQKYWFMLREKHSEMIDGSAVIEDEGEPHNALLSISPVSNGCPIQLRETGIVETLNGILRKVEQHPYVHVVRGIWLLSPPEDSPRDGDKVVVIYKFQEKGSLRDYIYQNPPCTTERHRLVSWSKKYSADQATALETKQIALFGKQILKAIQFLNNCGFHTLGHIHTGNIFLEEVTSDECAQLVCKLGGYSETLLGYKTRLYSEMVKRKLLKHIDIILFGHVIFEMGSGISPSEVLPTDSDYQQVKDESVRTILKFIFNVKKTSFKMIRKHAFFKNEKLPDMSKKAKVSDGEKSVFKQVNAPYHT